MSDVEAILATIEHISLVRFYINNVAWELIRRGEKHDVSKLYPPEQEVFAKFTDKQYITTYGSEEYKISLNEMKPALEHHYKANDHHPEYHHNGIKSMNLIQLLEMLCDWRAATLRHKDGNLLKSIIQNQERFGYSDELKEVLISTAKDMNWL